MAFLNIPNVKIAGIASCVPGQKQLVQDCKCLSREDAAKLSATTGIFERRVSNEETCTSDLCLAAANKLIDELKWERSSIEALIFVTQTPDFILPSTAPILQNKLNLSHRCLTLDISLGCSGYVYGLSTLATLVSSGSIKRALLLVGDTITKICSEMDKSTYPLFGDAGSATALMYDETASPIYASLYSDGEGYESIIVRDGGRRNAAKAESLAAVLVDEGISRSPGQLALNGMDVFSFGISKAPEVVRELLSDFNIDINSIDHFVFHQANKMMNEKIRKKLDIDVSKVPYSLELFGNTSCATIPLTITTQIGDQLGARPSKLLLCGFGVGLSWGALYVETDQINCLPLIEI
jgi:3-oxoacyl-[acyl-carrier-protein] synthase-3